MYMLFPITFQQEKKLTKIPPMNTNTREEVDEGIEFDGNLDSTRPKLETFPGNVLTNTQYTTKDGDSRPIIYPTEVDIPCLVFHKDFGNSATSESQPSTGEDFGSYFRSWNSDIIRTTATETEKAVIDDTGDTRDGTSSFINAVHEVSIGNSCFSDNPTSTQLSNVHHVIFSSGEEPGRPVVVDLNTLTQELDAQTSQFDKYKIDVAGLPAYTYSRTSIQEIERKCRKHLTKTRFSERDREAFLSKDVYLFTTVRQNNKFKFATSMDCRIEMKDIAKKMNCTYAPCVFVIQYRQLRSVAHIFEELQEKGLEFCVLILGPKSCINDMQTLHKRLVAFASKSDVFMIGHQSWITDMQTLHKGLVAFASESDMQDAVDGLLERFSFSVVRKLMEQIEIDANIVPDVCKTGDCNETLQEIYQQIRAAYNNSGVPEDERPLIPNNDFNYPSNVNEVPDEPAPASVLPPSPTATVSVAPHMQAQSTSIAPPPSLEQTPEKRIVLTSEGVSSATVETAPKVLAPPSLGRTVTLVSPPRVVAPPKKSEASPPVTTPLTTGEETPVKPPTPICDGFDLASLDEPSPDTPSSPLGYIPQIGRAPDPSIDKEGAEHLLMMKEKLRQEREDASKMEEQTKIFNQEHDQIKGSETNKQISQFDPHVPDEPAPASVLPPPPAATVSVAPPMQAQSTSIAPPPSLEQTPEKRIALTSEIVSSATVETAPTVLAPPSLERTVTLVTPPILAQTPGSVTPRTNINDILKQARVHSANLVEEEKVEKPTPPPPSSTLVREDTPRNVLTNPQYTTKDDDSRPIVYPTEVDIPCFLSEKDFGASATSKSQLSTGADFSRYFRSWNSDITGTTAKETKIAVIDNTSNTRFGTSSFINATHEVSIGNSCFSDNRSSTQLSNVHHVMSPSGEIPGRPEVVELNTLTQELDAQTSHFDKYKIDVAGLPAYTYSRTSIQDIERKCRKHLTKTRFSERDREAFLSKDVYLFTTVRQYNKFQFATSMDCRIEMKDIANTINCTYAPCVFVIEYKQLRTIAYIFEELQEKGLEFCVLILGHKSCINDMQSLHQRLVAFTSESDMQDAVDDLLERFSFSVLRKLMEQIGKDTNIGPNECKTGDSNETLQEIYQQIRAAYNNSEVPEDERPLIPKNEFNYPSNVNEISARVLQIQGVFACFKNNGRLKIYIDNTAVKSESECTNEVIHILAVCGFDKYSVFVGSLERYWQAGDAISNPQIEATLGGFANKCIVLSPPINHYQQENVQVHNDEPILVALISRHVATHLQSGDLKVSDKILGHIDYIHDLDWLDIVPVDVAKEFHNECETRFRTEDGILKHAELSGYTLENRSPVHIWGAKSAPGLGILSECDPSESNNYIFVASRSDENVFCVPGDSGSIVCSRDRKGRLFALAILIGKFNPSKIIEQSQQNGNYANKYDDISAEEQKQESNEHAQNKNEQTTCMGDETAHGTDNRTLITETLIESREGLKLEPTFVALNLLNAFKGLSEKYNSEFRLCREKEEVTA
ncbi:uncharacterized protein LOC127853028 isoform X2 [Dreissena polymorpha]|uniref:uncharacterized protein LOC127853028 isoform X2 n=1 Tax=Dreissena polymorpha TaxID=45954 RepID=UPI0022653D6D|nr:uncharacterized protein LOC127853028 isoform X2 [Dreissena polymorpha]